MTDIRKAAQAALEDLTAVLCDPEGRASIYGSDKDNSIVNDALDALRAALAQPEQQAQVDTCQMCGDLPHPGCKSEFQGQAACKFWSQPEQQAMMLTTPMQRGELAGDGKPCPNNHDPDCRWPTCKCRDREAAHPPAQPQADTISAPRELLARVVKIAWSYDASVSKSEAADLRELEALLNPCTQTAPPVAAAPPAADPAPSPPGEPRA